MLIRCLSFHDATDSEYIINGRDDATIFKDFDDDAFAIRRYLMLLERCLCSATHSAAAARHAQR